MTCQIYQDFLFKKGTPARPARQGWGWHGAVSAPCPTTSRISTFYDLGSIGWAEVNFYMALVASKRIRVRATSEAKSIFRMAVPSLSVCAVPTHSPEGSRNNILLLAKLLFRNKKHFIFLASFPSSFKKIFSKITSCQTRFFIPNFCKFAASSAAHCLPAPCRKRTLCQGQALRAAYAVLDKVAPSEKF